MQVNKKIMKIMSANNVKSCSAKDLDGGSRFFSIGIHIFFKYVHLFLGIFLK